MVRYAIVKSAPDFARNPTVVIPCSRSGRTMRPFKVSFAAVGLLMAVNAAALQATQAGDEASVLVVVAHALCSTSKSSRLVLDSTGAYASPILEAIEKSTVQR